MNASEIQTIVQRQRDYFASGATKPVERRLEMLRRLEETIRLREDDINAALKADLNKPPMESYMTETGMFLGEFPSLANPAAPGPGPPMFPLPWPNFPPAASF